MITSARSAKLHRRPRRSLGFRSFRMSTKVILIAVIAGVITPVAATSVAVATLLFGSLPGNLPEKKPSLVSYPSYVTDSAGNPIGVFREFDLTIPVQPADVPTVLKNAVVAAEDKRFWQHKGVDAWGLARAAWTNYSEGETVQGGSTITQQYVKNAYLTGERSLSRKLREAVLATQLERRMSKEEILFDYLNTIYFGSGAYGVGAAAVSYFGKSVKDLTLSEAATLAGLIPAPTVWSPRVDSRAAEGRRELVLKEMLDQRLVSQEEYDQAKALGLWLVTDGPPPAPATLVQPQPTKGGSAYPHVVDWVEQVLLAKYGPEKVYRGGLTVQTTLDPKLQSMAQQAVSAHLEGTSPPVDMALVSIEPATGLVKAMVGGRDYNSSQVNLATGGTLGFQPGSSFKPFTLATAFEQGIGPETVYNAPSRLKLPNCDGPDCYINNVEGGGGGRMTLRNATTNSVNTVFAQLIMDVGPQKVAEMANRLGVTAIKPGNDYGVSLTLGAYEVSPLDMATGYATFANGGVRQDATPILKVLDHDGHVLEDNSHRPGVRAVSANVAANVTDLLTGVVKSGTGTAARLDRPVAGKTGTAEEFRAAWFVGYTPQLATSVWMGYADGQRPLIGIAGVGSVYGGTIPARTWADFMKPAMKDFPVVQFPAPQKLVAEPPAQKPGTGSVSAQHTGTTGPPDTTVRAAEPQPAIETPNDCGGPCQLYSGSVNLPLQIGPGAAAASPSGTSPPR